MTKYSIEEKYYWRKMVAFYDNNNIKKSRNVIYVDFKNRKVIKGVSKITKNNINKKAA